MSMWYIVFFLLCAHVSLRRGQCVFAFRGRFMVSGEVDFYSFYVLFGEVDLHAFYAVRRYNARSVYSWDIFLQEGPILSKIHSQLSSLIPPLCPIAGERPYLLWASLRTAPV